jgi:hypothetical protein
MSEEPTPGLEEPSAIPRTEPARARSGRLLFWTILILLAFAAGVAVTLWAMPQATAWWRGENAAGPGAAGMPQRVVSTPVARRDPAALSDQLLDVRLAELEDRLTRITVEAQAASGNAARAEGLLVAFAARRALDSGAPLGYIEGQLRLRFGQAQPRAVATIINAAREPVTLNDLEAELDDIGPYLVGNPVGANWWTGFRREIRSLILIRKTSTPSPLPDRAFARARRLLESGRVDGALAEVDRLPGHASAERWMEMARRYREARRALDLVETAALLEPRQMRATDGSQVEQTSPLAP